MSEKIEIRVTFFEPFRIIPWKRESKRNTDRQYLRGGTFAHWHANDENGETGRPYVTGTLLRSALYAELEKLLALHPFEKCCQGIEKTRGNKPRFLRKRPRYGNERGEGPCGKCPLCRILGRNAQTGADEKSQAWQHKNQTVHFHNLKEEAGGNFYWEDIARQRILNRVDQTCGKARDYYEVYEISQADCPRFTGDVVFNDKKLEKDIENVKLLMAAGLSQVNLLAGALCRVDIISEPHDDLIRRFWQAETDCTSLRLKFGPSPDSVQLGGLDKLAGIMADAFEESQRRAYVRRLSDAIRDLRRYGPEILEKLPLGKMGGNPSVWNKKTPDGPTILQLLDLQAQHVSKDLWRVFCEGLGKALYNEYRRSGERADAHPRLLGEAEHHGLPMRKEDEDENEPIFLNTKSLPNRQWVISGTLRAVTPFYFGNESDETQTSANILLNRDGSFRLPRSSVRGALRRDLRLVFGDACNTPVGAPVCLCDVCRIMSHVMIRDAVSEYKEPPEIRHRIRLNPHTGTVEEGALFDMETGFQGIRFPFRMYVGSVERYLPHHLWQVLDYWRNGEAFFGGAAGTGFGRFQLENVRLMFLSLKKPAEYAQYQILRGFMGHALDKIKSVLPKHRTPEFANVCGKSVIEPNPLPYRKISYKITVDAPLLSRDPIAAMFDKRSPDAVMVRKTILNEYREGDSCLVSVPFVKSETIRGVLRSIVSQNIDENGERLYELDHEDCDCVQCRLFGSVHQQGKLRFEDAEVISEVEDRRMDHVAIDRFTGGGVDRLKYDDYPLLGKDKDTIELEGVFWIHGELGENEKKALESALAELKSGLVPLGGLGAIGYGHVAGFQITEGGDFLNLSETRLVSIGSGGRYALKPDVRSTLDPEKIYHPHYFIEPAPKQVEREAGLVSHVAGTDEDGQTLYTGKIVCKLVTKGPVFIPDTMYDKFFKMKEEAHKQYGFFRMNGMPAIPGSSLRGMVSSVYETLTHSCYRIMDTPKYLTRRVRPESEGAKQKGRNQSQVEESANGFLPGRLKIRDGKWFVEPMGEAVRLPLYDVQATVDSKINENEYKKKYPKDSLYPTKLRNAMGYNRLLAKAAEDNRAFLRNLTPERLAAILNGHEPVHFKIRKQERFHKKSGEKKEVNPNAQYAIMTQQSKNSIKGYVKFTGPDMLNVSKEAKTKHIFNLKWNPFNVNALPLHNDLEGRASQRKEYPRPVLACVKDGVEYRMYKRCERLFTEGTQSASEYAVPDAVAKQYRDILQDNRDNTEQIPDVFKNVMLRSNPENGDLIYFKADEAKHRVTDLAAVCISREVDDKPMGKRFPKIEIGGKLVPNDSLRPCTHTCLEDCDACPTRCGKVGEYFRPHPEGLCPACHLFGTPYYRGRVRFGMARLDGKPRWYNSKEDSAPKGGPLTLPLLERPRPTWSMPNKSSEIPGRKFYVHHPWTVDRLKANQPDPKSDKAIKITENNRTVEPLDSGNTFSFEVAFHNLRSWELGLLVWSLELEDNLAHKLGMAKAHGFGSVQIEVSDILFKEKPENPCAKADFIKAGFNRLGIADTAGTLSGFAHIRHLREMLWFPDSGGGIHVRYPELEREKEKDIPGYIDFGRKQMPETGNKNPDYMDEDSRLKTLRNPWREWHSKAKNS